MDPHRLSEERSLAFHRAVAERLSSEPGILERARARVALWIARGEPSERYARSWQRILDRPTESIRQVLLDPGEDARALRQVTPFAGAIDPRARWRIWREIGARARATAK